MGYSERRRINYPVYTGTLLNQIMCFAAGVKNFPVTVKNFSDWWGRFALYKFEICVYVLGYLIGHRG